MGLEGTSETPLLLRERFGYFYLTTGSASVIGLLSLYGIFRFQLGCAFFYAHDPILAAHAIPYLSNYLCFLKDLKLLFPVLLG